MRLRRAMSAGLADASLASVATLLVGVYAARFLEPRVLGAYAVYFTAFITASSIPGQLLFVPAEIVAASRDAAERFKVLSRTMRISVPVSLLGALAAGSIAWGVTAQVGELLPLFFTHVSASVVSPIQDHVRRLHHHRGQSWDAAKMSAAQLVGVSVGVAAIAFSGLGPLWVPFGALTFANVVSLSYGLRLGGELDRDGDPELSARALVASGWHLMIAGMAAPLTALGLTSLVLWLGGPEIVGYAEAARVASRPVLVVTTGLGSALRPRIMAAVARSDWGAALGISGLYRKAVLGLGFVYMAVTALPWLLNPFGWLTPVAYTVPGLVAVAVLGNMMLGLSFPGRYQLLGARRQEAVASIEMWTQATRLGVAALTSAVGAFVIPLGDVVLGGTRVMGYSRKRRQTMQAVKS